MDRRKFLRNLSVTSTGLAFACASFSKRVESFESAKNFSHLKSVGFGELTPTATKNTGETFLALPKGFEYNVMGKVGTKMSDGNPTPSKHDGMATFEVGNQLRIIRNHEVTNSSKPIAGSAIGANPYDESAGGGTTTLVINPKTRELVTDFVSLSGTLVNCAGGPTPWGSWVTCEETTLGQSIRTNSKGVQVGGFAKPHGYCFEVFASANSSVTPTPLKDMGRFVHEAIAVDKKTGIVYLTEDANTAGFYRFLPKRNKRLAEGGTLQILKIKDKDAFDTRTGQKTGMSWTTNWVTIEKPDPIEADLDPAAVYKEGLSKGAATFARLEGIWADKKGRMYFDATSGGDAKAGQIFLYEPTSKDEGRLTLLFESPSRQVLDMPDNICLHPKNELLFICEDSDYAELGGLADNFVRILTKEGKIADFAKNIAPKFEHTEFCGSVFSKDGKTMYVNLQGPGVTLAIWGDWNKFQK